MIVPDHQVDLWCAFLEEGEVRGLDQLYRSVLSADEAQRYARFHLEKDRRQFLLTRALVRDVLSRYVGLKPSALVFTRNEYGKPVLAEPAACPVAFSLSHTKGLSVCAVACQGMIGVDVESLTRINCNPEIAHRFFAPSEAAYLEQFDADQKRREFLRLWTLKEAYIKARGLGLSIPLDSFEIASSPGQSVRLSFQNESQGNGENWRFLQVCLKGSYQIAMAMPTHEEEKIAVQLAKIVPLTEQRASVLLDPNPLNEWTLDAL